MRVAAATMGLRAYLLPHRGSVKFSRVFFCHGVVAMRVARVIFPCPRVRAARYLLMRYTDVQFEETKLKGVLS